MKTYKLELYGEKYNIYPSIEKYANNDTLAICLDYDEGPFAILTVNLPISMANSEMQYVDTNNCPWAEEFIKKNGLGEPTGIMGYSGFYSYPLYKFNLEALR